VRNGRNQNHQRLALKAAQQINVTAAERQQ
jgi:hypothetical protein